MREHFTTDISLIDSWHLPYFATQAVDLDLNNRSRLDYFSVTPGTGIENLDDFNAFFAVDGRNPYSGEILDYIYDADLMEQYMYWQEKEFKYHKWYPQYTGVVGSGYDKWYRHHINSSGLFANSGTIYDIRQDNEFVPSTSGVGLQGHVAKSMSFMEQVDDRNVFIQENYYPVRIGFADYGLTGHGTNPFSGNRYYFDYSQNNWTHHTSWEEKIRWSHMLSQQVIVNHYSASNNEDVYWWDSWNGGGWNPLNPEQYPAFITPYWTKKPAADMEYVGSEWVAPGGSNHFIQTQAFPTTSGYYFSDISFSATVPDSGTTNPGDLISPSGSNYIAGGYYTQRVHPSGDIINTQQLVVNNQIVFRSTEVAAGFAIFNTNYAVIGSSGVDGLASPGVGIGGIPAKDTIGEGQDQTFRRLNYINDGIGATRHTYRLFYPREIQINANPDVVFETDITTTTVQNRLGWVKEFDGMLQDLKADIPAERQEHIPSSVLWGHTSRVWGGSNWFYVKAPINHGSDNIPFPALIPGRSQLSDFKVVMGSGFTGLRNVKGHLPHKFFQDLMRDSFVTLGDLDGEIDYQKVMDHKGSFYLSIVPKDFTSTIPKLDLPAVIADETFTVTTPKYKLRYIKELNPEYYWIVVKGFTGFGSYGLTFGKLIPYNGPGGGYTADTLNFTRVREVSGAEKSIFDITNEYEGNITWPTRGVIVQAALGSSTVQLIGDITMTIEEERIFSIQLPPRSVPAVQTGPYFSMDTVTSSLLYGTPQVYYVAKKVANYTSEIPGSLTVNGWNLQRASFTVDGETREGLLALQNWLNQYDLVNQYDIIAPFDSNSTVFSYGGTTLGASVCRPDYIPVSQYGGPRMAAGGMSVSNHLLSINEATTENLPGLDEEPSRFAFMGQTQVGDGLVVHGNTNLGAEGNGVTNWRGAIIGHTLPHNTRHVGSVIRIPVTNDTSTVDIVKRVYPSGKIVKSSN